MRPIESTLFTDANKLEFIVNKFNLVNFKKRVLNLRTKAIQWLLKNQQPWLAILVLILGITLLGIMGAMIKYLGEFYSPTLLAVARNIFGFVPVLLLLLITNKSIFSLAGEKNMMLLIIRGGSIAFAQFCFYLALMKLQFATASTLVFAGPLFLTALSVPILGARVGIWRWAAVIIGFFGIVLIMDVGTELFNIFALLPLGAAFGYALSSVLVKLFSSEVSTAQIQLYTQAITLFSATILLVMFSGYSPINSRTDFFLISLMGISGGCGVLCLVSAYRIIET